MDEFEYYIRFSHLLGIGPTTFKKLVSHYGSAKNAYLAPIHELKEIISTKLAEKIKEHRNTFDIKRECDICKESNIVIITQKDSRYPNQLLNLEDPPICLYVKGDLKNYNFGTELYLAIVGTRKPTYYGELIATQFAAELAQAGLVIVSGLALGIDALAHTAALEVGGKTIAFLGCGVNIQYPPANRNLYKRILNNKGLIISEVPPNMQVIPGLFVQRNRLISGLSRGILVAEGLKDSGSLITARFAAEQGKDVFAPPAPINSEYSEAPNLLLKEGAKLVTSVKDILDEYAIASSDNSLKIIQSLSEREEKIYYLIKQHPIDSDEISRKLNIPIYKLLITLSDLEIKDLIIKKGGIYSIKPR
jgi:DNA processing protein